MTRFASQQGNSFLTDKTHDAIIFLKILSQKYDIAVANPPYTDNFDFGPELKKYVEDNFKIPYKFHTNLYATLLKRNFEFTNESGIIAMIHPNTFMFIKTFEGVRKYILEQSRIDLLVDYGLDRVNLFGGDILLDSNCWYVIDKNKTNRDGVYFNISTNQQEKFKKESLNQAVIDFINHDENKRVITLNQNKFKFISGIPFIYWISDEFRESLKDTQPKI